MQLPQLRRVRWAVRIALTLGVAASVAANVLHARPNFISQAIAAWPPLALLLTVELTSRIPMHRRVLAAFRVFATVAIAGIAAWVSYWHMASVAANYGETDTSAYLLPLSVDGLIVVASVSLVELAGRIRILEDQRAKEAQAAKAAAAAPPVPAVVAEPVRPAMPQPQPAPQPVFAPTPTPAMAPTSAVPVSPAVGPSVPTPRSASAEGASVPQWVNGSKQLPQRPTGGRVVSATSAPLRPTVTSQTRPVAPAAAPASTPAPTATVEEDSSDADGNAPRQRRPVQETAALADAIEAMHPNISQTDLARQLGISPTRLRAVRREAREIRRASRLRTA